jgi:serine/threonine protein kinase
MIGAGAPPVVPGLVLARRLGTGEHGEVWRAVDLLQCDERAARAVLVQIGRPAGSPGAAAREAALLRRVDHENLARLRSVLDLPDGRRAVVLDLEPRDDLAALVARRGPLPTGEVLTVAIALARALEHAHALGLVHGRLGTHDVLFTGDGRPVLAGLGIPSLLAPLTADGPPVYPTPADDVRGLGEVLRYALTGGRCEETVPGPLAPVVVACLASDPGERPTPTRVASLAWEAGSALPVDLGEGGFAFRALDEHPDGLGQVRRSHRRGLLGIAIGMATAARARAGGRR